jgi:hypothetical protein
MARTVPCPGLFPLVLKSASSATSVDFFPDIAFRILGSPFGIPSRLRVQWKQRRWLSAATNFGSIDACR